MPIFVSEPARPGPQRLPSPLRRRDATPVSGAGAGTALDTKARPEDNRGDSTDRRRARAAAAEYRQSGTAPLSPDLPYLPVSQLAVQSIITVQPSATLSQAQALMAHHGIHHLVVLHENQVAGIIDLVWLLEQQAGSPAQSGQMALEDLVLPAFITVTPETDAHELARQMLGHQIVSALVVDADNQGIALVTATDYLRLYAQSTERHDTI